jgi:hypothetical protein
MLDKKARWFFIILAVIWLFITLVITIVLILILKDVRSFMLITLTTPPTAILHHLYRYHFPIPHSQAMAKGQKIPE